MSRLDDELKLALRREEAPAGFADRVIAQAESRRGEGRRWWMGAIAAGLLLAAGLEYERERQIREGEQAKEQVMLALRITSSKLQFVKEKIHAIDFTH